MRWGRVAVWWGVLAATATAFGQDGPTYTMHVYTNVIQIATMIVEGGAPVPAISQERFSVRLDGGRTIKPERVRVEGDDPITLAVLLDQTGNDEDLSPALPGAFESLAKTALKPQDRLSIFAVDCTLVRTLAGGVGTAGGVAGPAVERALAAPGLHQVAGGDGEKDKRGCAGTVHLNDAVGKVMQSIGAAPGRRVVVVVSRGLDRGSALNTGDVAVYANGHAIALFGVGPGVAPKPGDVALLGTIGAPARPIGYEANFKSMCEISGGLVSYARQAELGEVLAKIVTILRGRYIVDFPRPDRLEPGPHNLQVHVLGLRGAVIKPSGASLPLADPKTPDGPGELAAPTAAPVAPASGEEKLVPAAPASAPPVSSPPEF